MDLTANHAGQSDLVARLVAAKNRAARALALALGLPDPDQANETARLAGLLAAAQPPEACGPAMPVAPARGPVVAFAPRAMLPKGEAGYELQHAGYRGRDALRSADAFDRMQAQAARAAKGAAPLFTPHQVLAGRGYAALLQRYAARGQRCVSLETMLAGRSGSSGLDFMDVVLRESELIGRMRAAMGDGLAVAPVRLADGVKRRPIPVRALVDMVCCEEVEIDKVIKHFGWAACGGLRDRLRQALCAALDRISAVA